MITMSFTMQKGGVGKTTSAINIAAALTRRKDPLKVLLVDMDGQQNLSDTYNLSDQPNNIYTFLMDPKTDMPVEEIGPNLYLIPGSDLMHTFDRNVMHVNKLTPSTVLANRFNEYDLESIYDVIIFDCPPKMDFNTMNVLTYVEWVFIPVSADKFSISGVTKTIEGINEVKAALNKNLKIGGIFLTRHDDRTTLYRKIREALTSAYGDKVLEYYTRRNVETNEAIINNTDVFTYDERNQKVSNGSKDYENIAREILFITANKSLANPIQQ